MISFLDLQKVNSRYAVELKEAAQRVIDSGWYLSGKEVEAFEKEYADYIGTDYCVTCGNGLDALTLMLRAYLQLGKLHEGDEIIVPANTFLATVLAITENNLTPVLVDPDIRTLQIDASEVEKAITPKTRAVLLVHLYGVCSYTDKIYEICKNNDFLILEDNAQAHGCTFISEEKEESSQLSGILNAPLSSKNHRKTGSLGHSAAHSFYPGKNLGALGDSGAVTTNDKLLADTIRSLGNYGFSKKYYADHLGRNSRMDEMQAAILRVKLRHLDADNRNRQRIAKYYYQHINNPLVQLPQVGSVFHIFTIFCEQRDRLQEYLKEKGIQTLIHYPVPPHLQKCYPEYNTLYLPITEQLAQRELSLPISPVLTLEEAQEVVEAVNAFSI